MKWCFEACSLLILQLALLLRITVSLPVIEPAGHEQPVNVPGPLLAPVAGCASDILFVVDSTGSVNRDFQNQVEFVQRVVEGLAISPQQQQVGIVVYSSKLRQKIYIPLGEHHDKASLLAAVKALPYFSGTTATGEALTLGKKALAERRPGLLVNIIVVTDGFSWDSVQEPADELRKEPNVRMVAVGIAQSLNRKELELIAGQSDRVFIGIDSASAVLQQLGTCTELPRPPAPPAPSTPSAPVITTPTLPVTTATPPATTTQPAPKTEPPPPSVVLTTKRPPPFIPAALPPEPLIPGAAPFERLVEGDDPLPTDVPATVSPKPLMSAKLPLISAVKPPPPPPLPPVPATKPPAPVVTTAKSSPPSIQTTISPKPLVSTKMSPPPVPSTTKPPPPPIQTTISPKPLVSTKMSPPPVPSTTKPPPLIAPVAVPALPVATSAKPPAIPPPPLVSRCFLDIMFVIDASGSVEETFRKEIDLASNIIDGLVLGDVSARVALIRFAGHQKAKTIFSFDTFSDKEAMKKAIENLPYTSGTTATDEALELAEKEFSQEHGARLGQASPVMIVFTDGYSQSDPKEAAEKIRLKGIPVYAVGIDQKFPANKAELTVIAGDPSRVFTAETFDQFQAELKRITINCHQTR